MNICILGSGAWGTAMALHLNRCGHSVTLVPRRYEVALELASGRVNKAYLPEHTLPNSIQIAAELAPALMEAEIICLACPSKGLRDLCSEIEKSRQQAWRLRLFVVLCKGLELDTLKTPSEIVGEVFPEISCGVLSGPTYAADVATGLPAAVTLALKNGLAESEADQAAFNSNSMRVYLTEDIRGTELGGTLKNIYAIASGLCDGLKLGDNAKAALLTRSMSELVQIGTQLGGKAGTFYGLSGFGDLIATCTGEWSRNRSFGQLIGEGKSPEEILKSKSSVVEGYRAARCIKELCQKNNQDAPILSEVHSILYEGKEPQSALNALMARDLKAE